LAKILLEGVIEIGGQGSLLLLGQPGRPPSDPEHLHPQVHRIGRDRQRLEHDLAWSGQLELVIHELDVELRHDDAPSLVESDPRL
jgi:hypothetical protein